MGQLYLTINQGTADEVALPFAQAMTLARLSKEHPGSHWHTNDCGCCVTLHPGGAHDKGYVINSDGDDEYIEL